jgi:uncharacterized SAM-binding protein YcdF (DUF218 family)
MSASWIFNAAVGALLLPPLNLILLCVLGLWLTRRHPRTGATLSVLSLVLLIALSTRPGAMLVVAPLEKLNAPLSATDVKNAQAIVVLGAGRISNAPEYGGQDIPSSIALQRLRYAAKLQRETGLPILITGGRPDGSAESEAAIMARTLREDFVVPVRWLEPESNNTAENAQFSAAILRKAGVQRILLVTDAMHMQRARLVFKQTGLTIVAAPTAFTSAESGTAVDLIPHARWLQYCGYAMHEWLGLAWYRLRHQDRAE